MDVLLLLFGVNPLPIKRRWLRRSNGMSVRKVATSCLAPFALRDVTTIQELVDEAGFHVTGIQKLVLMRRMQASVLDFASSQPYGRDVELASETSRAAIEREVITAVESYRSDDGGFVLPQESHLVLAQIA